METRIIQLSSDGGHRVEVVKKGEETESERERESERDMERE
jgi:hypothetical protein